MNKFDISENQYWVLIWGGVFVTVIMLAFIINHNSNYEKRLTAEQHQSMMDKGYVQVVETTCYKYSTDKVWKLQGEKK